MSSYSFSLALEPLEVSVDEAEDRLFESGCDDALLSISAGQPTLDFTRESASLDQALLSALRDIAASGVARVVRVEPDDLVNASDIARRSGKSKEAVRLWVSGARGPGGFPSSVSTVGSSPVWRWHEVAKWLFERGHVGEEEVANALRIAAYNQLLSEERQPTLVLEVASVRGAFAELEAQR